MKQSARVAYLLLGLTILAALIFAPVTGLADTTEVKVSALEGGVTVQSPSGGITVEHVNRRPSWAPFVYLSRVLGTSPRDGEALIFRSSSAAAPSIPFRFSLFGDEQQGLRLEDGILTLKAVKPSGTVSGSALTLASALPQNFVVVPSGSSWIRPGIYKGDLLLGKDETPISVTVQVRDPAWLAVIVTLIGLGANLLLNLYRKEEEYLEEKLRLRQIVKLLNPAPPKLIMNLLHWANLSLGTPQGKALAAKEITFAEMLLQPGDEKDKYPDWILKLDDLKNIYYWEQIRDAIEKLDATTPQKSAIHAAIIPIVKTEIQGYPEGVQRENLAFAPQRNAINDFLTRWVFGGATLLVVRVAKTLAILAAVGATVWASITLYNQAPAFGSDIKANYFGVFMVGYVGKEFHDLLQTLAPKILGGKTAAPGQDSANTSAGGK